MSMLLLFPLLLLSLQVALASTTNLIECQFLLLVPFSTEPGDRTLSNYTEVGAHYAAAAQMAIDALNYYEGCLDITTSDGTTATSVLFHNVMLRDTQEEDTIGFQELVRAVESNSGIRSVESNDAPVPICGVVGPLDGKGQEKTITYTEVHGLPTMTFVGMDIDDLAGKDGKTSIGNMMDLKEWCHEFAYYVKHYMGLTHLVIILGDSKTARKMEDDMLEAMTEQGLELRILKFKEEKHKDWEKTRQDLEQVKLTGIHNVFLMGDYRIPEALYWFAQHLDDMEMLEGDYQYFLWEQNVRPREIDFLFGQHLQVDSPMARLLNGAAWFNTMEPYELAGEKDSFVQQFQRFDPNRIDYPDTATPVTQNHFETAIPMRLSGVVYDSVLAMGRGICAAIAEELGDQKGEGGGGGDKDKKDEDDDKDSNANDNQRRRRFLQHKKPPKPPKNPVVRNIVQQEPFQGASGTVSFDYNKDERFRTVDTLQMAMWNFRTVPHPLNASMVTVQAPIVAHLNKEQSPDWQVLEPFVYGSQSKSTLPTPQFVIAEENYLSGWVFGIGMLLFVFGALFAVASFVAVTYYQKDRAVLMAQPFFLKLICLGSLMEVTAILPLSLDESHGLDDGQLDAACMSVPWLFFIGHAIIYSAIFCKLWRIDQVMSAQRRTRTELQVLWPLGVVLLAVVTILIVWTAVSPWRWERDFVNLTPPETYGKCYSEDFAAFFAPLAIILMGCTFLTGIFVWRTKDISQDLSDTSTVFYLIVTQLQAWFVGLPILAVIGDSSVDSVYFGRILLIWVFAMAPLLIVILPRLCSANHLRRHPSVVQRNKGRNVHISGIDPRASTTMSTTHGARSSVVSSTTSRPSEVVAALHSTLPMPGEDRSSITSNTAGFNHTSTSCGFGFDYNSKEFGGGSESSKEGDFSGGRMGMGGGLATLSHISENPMQEAEAMLASERRLQAEKSFQGSSHHRVVEQPSDQEQQQMLTSLEELPEGSSDSSGGGVEHDENPATQGMELEHAPEEKSKEQTLSSSEELQPDDDVLEQGDQEATAVQERDGHDTTEEQREESS